MDNPLTAIDRDPSCWLAGAEAALNILETSLLEQGALNSAQRAAVARVRMLVRRLAGGGAGDVGLVAAELEAMVELIA